MQANKELSEAWDFVEHTGTSIFLTGKAGTGKTTFLRTVRAQSSKRMIVVAPTGVAAINAGGVTIHSFFQLPLSPYIPGATIRERFDFSKEKRRIISSLDMLVIDEISMVRADLLDAVDFVLRRYRDRTQPFGGLQLLMIGDLQQLTPVIRPDDEETLSKYYDTPYFFGSKALAQISYVTIQLTHVYRQQDEAFITLLNHIRDGHPSAEDLNMLNARCNPAFIPKPEQGYIRLTTHNRLADNYNENELSKLPGKRHVFKAEVNGDFPTTSCPAEEDLQLKEGAQVMFLKNDPSHRFYNGKIGHVVSIDEEGIGVRCTGEKDVINVDKDVWENTKYTINPTTKTIESKVQGTFTQYPLRLAWAITIHKSQGLTFEHAIIDAGLSFASGQVYVALSRCKSLEGLVLASRIGFSNIFNDSRVTNYISHQQAAAEESISQLPQLKENYFRQQLADLFFFSRLYDSLQSLYHTIVEFFHGYPRLTDLYRTTIEQINKEVMTVSLKWRNIILQMPTGQLHSDEMLLRVRRSADYFATALKKQLPTLLAKTKDVKGKNKKGLEQLDERYKDLWLQYLSKEKLLDRMADETFNVGCYLKAKQETMLDAMDRINPGKQRRQSTRKPSARGAVADTDLDDIM